MNRGEENLKTIINDILNQDVKSMGKLNKSYLNETIVSYLDNKRDNFRYEILEKLFQLNKSKKILDVGSGFGCFVFNGLESGYDVYGIEPSIERLNFCKDKINALNYPANWAGNFLLGTGEAIPFNNNFFDLTSSYQVLEHVENVNNVLEEMLRVTSCGGGLHIMCPDYRSFFEPHYRIFMLPLMPAWLVKLYLKLIGRRYEYWKTLNYTTKSKIIQAVKFLSCKNGYKIEIIDVDKLNLKAGIKRKMSIINRLGLIYNFFKRIPGVLSKDKQVNLFIRILEK